MISELDGSVDKKNILELLQSYLSYDSINSQTLQNIIYGVTENTVIKFDSEIHGVIGHMIYCYASNEAIYQKIKYGEEPKYHYEWSEGDIIWVIDIALRPGFTISMKNLRTKLRDIARGRVVFFKGKNCFHIHHKLKKVKLYGNEISDLISFNNFMGNI